LVIKIYVDPEDRIEIGEKIGIRVKRDRILIFPTPQRNPH